jgi:hypothetical protein
MDGCKFFFCGLTISVSAGVTAAGRERMAGIVEVR